MHAQYASLVVPEEKWFRMSHDQRVKWLHKFNTCTVKVAVTPSIASDSAAGDITIGHYLREGTILSVPFQDVVHSSSIPQASTEGTWKKASTLIHEVNSIVNAPGLGEKDKMVKSSTGSTPHLVIVSATSSGIQYKCDEKCPQYKSLHICSHCVAAAEANGDLADFIKWFCHKHGKKTPNLTELATHGMPAGAGRKGGKPVKKRKQQRRTQTDEVRVPLQSSPPTVYNVNVSASEASSVSTLNAYVSTASDLQKSVASRPDLQYPSASNWSSHYPPYQANFPWVWTSPPWMSTPPPTSPVAHVQSAHSSSVPHSPSSEATSTDTYKVCFKIGNISIYNGCRNKFSKDDKIVIQHAEFRTFTNPRTGLPASKFGNAYYHANKRCIELKLGHSMNLSDVNIVIPDSLKGGCKTRNTE